jgi:hypothetical protein
LTDITTRNNLWFIQSLAMMMDVVACGVASGVEVYKSVVE